MLSPFLRTEQIHRPCEGTANTLLLSTSIRGHRCQAAAHIQADARMYLTKANFAIEARGKTARAPVRPRPSRRRPGIREETCRLCDRRRQEVRGFQPGYINVFACETRSIPCTASNDTEAGHRMHASFIEDSIYEHSANTDFAFAHGAAIAASTVNMMPEVSNG